MKTVVGLVGLAMVGAVQAQQPARSVQQDFEAAAALDAGADKAAALAAWEALERRVAARPRNRAIVLVRKSAALLALDRKDEAVAAARAGLAGLPEGERSLRPDRFNAYLNLGRIAASSLDYASAAEAFGDAERAPDDPVDVMTAGLGIVRTATFTDPAASAAAATRVDAVVATQKFGPKVLGAVAEAKGVMLLNRGDLRGAQAATMQAVKQFGGLTDRIDTSDVAARSDAAIVLLLQGKDDEARHYMAMTGAGNFGIGQVDPGTAMVPPDCGGEAGLRPDDMAVVEFSVADDGTARAVRPIYAAGGGQVALEFARAVRQWSWTTEQVKAMPPFLRYNARVELRCNLGFERPSVGDGLRAATIGWGTSKGLTFADRPQGMAEALAAQRAALASAAGGQDTLGTLPALYALIGNPVLPREERLALARRALAVVRAADAPVPVLLDLDLAVRIAAEADASETRTFRRIGAAMLAERSYAADAQARAVLRLLLADNEGRSGKAADAWLTPVADDAALAANDPLKVGAMIRLASIAQNRGDTDAARATFARSGLAASQCALIDKEPVPVSAGGTFPTEARRWGFEGWTRTQFDIDPSGRVAHPRAIISYPPFVFTRAGTETIAGARYSKTYRPDGGLGCGALIRGVRFKFYQ